VAQVLLQARYSQVYIEGIVVAFLQLYLGQFLPVRNLYSLYIAGGLLKVQKPSIKPVGSVVVVETANLPWHIRLISSLNCPQTKSDECGLWKQ
jgi:hypothetical protein